MSRGRSLINHSLIQGLLLALMVAVYWWWRQRSNQLQKTAQEEPVTWRRDIEMGPSEEEGSQAAMSRAEEVVIEAIPDVRAGDGGLSDEGTVEAENEDTPVEPAIAEMEKTRQTETPAGDDLEIVEGIGPKINTILQAAGIYTFAQLAETEVTRLEEILQQAGMRRINNPESWPDQARLAASGDWNALETLQKSLKAGRR